MAAFATPAACASPGPPTRSTGHRRDRDGYGLAATIRPAQGLVVRDRAKTGHRPPESQHAGTARVRLPARTALSVGLKRGVSYHAGGCCRAARQRLLYASGHGPAVTCVSGRVSPALLGWPRLPVLTAVEAGLPEGTPGVVYLVVDDEGTGHQVVIGIRERAPRPALPDDRPMWPRRPG